MRTLVIIGSTREVARGELEKGVKEGIVQRDYYDEVIVDDCRIMAIGGAEDDVCWLRGLGFNGVEIVTVGDGISEAMWRRIRWVRTTIERDNDA